MSDAPAAPRGNRLRRWALRLLLGGVVLVVAVVLARNFLMRRGLETAVTRETGFPFTIGSFSLGFTDSRMEVTGMALRNPPGFEDPRCLEVPRLVADLEFGSLFREPLHVEEIVLEVQEVVVVRNAAGETNLDRLKALAGNGKGGAEGRGETEGKGPKKWKCDRLELTLRRVLYVDYTRMKDGKPREEVFDLEVDHEVFRDVDGAEKIVKLIVLKVLKGTPIKLLNSTVESLTEGVGGAVQQGVKGVGDALGGLLGGEPKEPARKKRR